jgi:HTH-type transcriptional regulator / antitoxin HigA
VEEMSIAAGVLDKQKYSGLLADVLPHVIHTEEENEQYTSILEGLLNRKDRTVEENRLAELLTLLIEDFEDKRYSLPPSSPLDVVRHLMDANGLRQADLLDVFGTASVASEVLNGKRDLSKSHIQRLSQRFRVSPALFFASGQRAA